MPFLGGIFGGNSGGAQTAAQQQRILGQGTTWANNELSNSERDAISKFATNYYDPYTLTGGQANSMYANALGLNGQGGNQTAQGAFQTGPGYQFALGQGIQALDRSAAGSGMFGSGNAAMAMNRYGQGIGNQEYNNWLSRLSGLGSQGFDAARGQTSRQGDLANINLWGGGRRAANYQEYGKNASDAFGTGAYSDIQANAQGGRNILDLLGGGINWLSGGLFGGSNLRGR